MRRIDLLIDDCRRSVESQLTSSAGGISDEEYLQYLNAAQYQLYSAIVQKNPDILLADTYIDLVANQESYDMPSDLHLGTSIKHVWYKYGLGTADYTLIPQGPISSRRSDLAGSYIDHYVRDGSSLKVVPTPTVTLSSGLRVTYQRKLRRLDVRRGVITAISKTVNTLSSLTISLTPSLGKDSGTVAAAKSMLNKADKICVVKKNGEVVLANIPIDSYNSTTGVITVGAKDDGTVFTTTKTSPDFVSMYVVIGDFSTTHCDLPDENIERYLLVYTRQCLLRRQGNPDEVNIAVQEMQAILGNILDSYEVPDQDLKLLPPDTSWGGSSFFGGGLATGGSGSGSGQLTAANVGLSGVGLFKEKDGSLLKFNNIDTNTACLAISLDSLHDTVDIDFSFLGFQDLADPNADRIMFWDDSAGKLDWLGLNSTLSISGTTLGVASSLSSLFTADSGTATPASNNLNIVGTSIQGISTSGSGSTISLTAANASTTQKGVSSFNTTHFSVSSGAVSAKDLTVSAGTGLTGGGSLTLGGSTSLALSTPVSVANGGTGASTLTSHGVIVGEGTSALTALSVGTTGQVLIGSTGADPAFGALGLNSSLTNHGILLGQNNSAIAAMAAGTAGQVVLSGGSSADPGYVTPTAGTGLAVTTNATTLSYALTTPVSVSNGGTGASTLTAHSIILGQGTSALTALGAATNGQIPIGSTGADPVLAIPTNGNNVSWTGGAGSLTANLTGTTNHAVQIGNSTNSLTSLSVGTTGQVLIGSTAGDPAFGSLGVNSALTNHGVLLGQNNSAIAATSAGSSGQLLVSGGASADPGWTTLTHPTTNSQGDLLYGSASNVLSTLAKDTNSTRYLSNTGTSNNPAWAQIALTTGVSGTLPEGNGGTNQSTYTQGDILYASAANTLSKLAKDTSSTRYLSNTGSSNSPAWSQIGLTTGVTGVLPEANGGTNQSTYAQGDLLYASASNTLAKLAKDTNSTRYLSNTGTSNAPTWAQIGLTTGVTGTLPVANGGSGAATFTAHSLLVGEGTSAFTALGAATNGQIPIGSTGADPVLAAIASADASVTITNGAGTIDLRGRLTQSVSATSTTRATTTTVIPLDDTIPQSSEGSEYLTVSITPKSSSSVLEIEFTAWMGCSNALVWLALALFQDSTAGALQACVFTFTSGYGGPAILRYRMTSGTTSSTTFKIRYGPHTSAGSATAEMLGASGGGYFSTSDAAFLTVKEYN